MSWLTDPKGCGNCHFCGMDMDMEPYCSNLEVTRKLNAQYGVNINVARREGPCGPEGKLFQQRTR